MIWELLLKARRRWGKPRRKYYGLNFYRGQTCEIAIVRLEGNNKSGPVLTERELLPDLAQIPTAANGNGIWHNGLNRPCNHALLAVLKNHTRQIKPEQAAEIEQF